MLQYEDPVAQNRTSVEDWLFPLNIRLVAHHRSGWSIRGEGRGSAEQVNLKGVVAVLIGIPGLDLEGVNNTSRQASCHVRQRSKSRRKNCVGASVL